MPELPEVETTVNGIKPYLEGQKVVGFKIHNPNLRWPVSQEISEIKDELVDSVERRAKYILVHFKSGTVIMHLGMSGSMRVITNTQERLKHDHIEILLDSGIRIRFNDPRRFGCALWTNDWHNHALISALGPEPLTPEFNETELHQLSRKKKTNIKQFIMNGHIVVGVGNIYANEALFLSGIRPTKQAGRVSKADYAKLVKNIKSILQSSITQGGTTLRDFINSDGKPGYFKQQLFVYGRQGQNCKQCSTPLKEIRQNNRSSVFCPSCQS